MSSKKKQTKDKFALNDDAAANASMRPVRDWLLADAAVVQGNNSSPAFSTARHITTGRPSGAVRMSTWTEKRRLWLDSAAHEGGKARGDVLAEWRSDVAERLPSPAMYPHHTLRLTMAHRNSDVHGSTAKHIASIIRRILVAHTKLTNACYDSAEASAYEPDKDVERLVGIAVYATGGYCGPEVENKNTTFHSGYSTVANGNRDLRYVSHSDSTHVNVCCGPYYYQLTVVDSETGALFDEDKIASSLETIHEHAVNTDRAFNALQISEEDREQLSSVRDLLARLTTVHDDVEADVHRRLRDVSAVNTYSLEQLEGGLFTIVLVAAEEATTSVNPTSSQWLHSCLSLYVSWPTADGDGDGVETKAEAPRQSDIVARVSAFAASLEAVQGFFAYAFSDCTSVVDAAVPAGRADILATREGLLTDRRLSALAMGAASPIAGAAGTSSTARPSSSSRRSLHQSTQQASVTAAHETPAPHDSSGGVHAAAAAEEREGDKADATGDAAASKYTGKRHVRADRCTPLNDDGAATYLELWLPQKHRVPLMPAAPSLLAPQWTAMPLEQVPALVDFCLCVVLGVEATVKKDPSFGLDGRARPSPRVVLSLLQPELIAPTSRVLATAATDTFIRVHRSTSALITADVRRHARQAARDSLAELIQSCMGQQSHASCTDDADDSLAAGLLADVNITVAVTARAAVKGTKESGSLVSFTDCFTETGVPAVLQLRCNAVQERAEKALSLPACRVHKAVEVGASDENASSAVGLLIANTALELAQL